MKALTPKWQPRETIHEGGEAKAWALAYDGNKKEMVGSWRILSFSNERKFFDGDNILQIKRGKCEAYNINN